jgi:hypothetical protein
MVVHVHSLPAPATYDKPLQQRRAFTRRAPLTFYITAIEVLRKPPHIFLELFQGNVTLVSPGDEDHPLFPWQPLVVNITLHAFTLAVAAIKKYSGITRIVEQPNSA